MMTNLNWQPGMTLELIEKHAILQAFRFYRGNKTVTAAALGIAIRTLDNKLESYQKDDKEQERIQNEQRRKREEFSLRERGIPRNNAGVAVAQKIPNHIFESNSGLHVESIANAAPQHAVPVQERKEVQTLLQKNPSKSGHNKNR